MHNKTKYIYIYNVYCILYIIYIYILYIYKYIIYTYIQVLIYNNSCVHYVHHVPKYMSYHKAFVVITGRAHRFHDYISVIPILLL